MTDNTAAPIPGWYPAPHANGEQRYWDGARWTEWTPESAAAAQANTSAPAAGAAPAAAFAATGAATTVLEAPPTKDAPAKKPGLKWWVWALIAFGVLVVLVGIINAITGGSSDDDALPAANSATNEEEAVAKDQPVDTRVEVPAVVGNTVAEARAAIQAAGLTLVVVDGTGDDWVILTQTITQPSEPGTEILVTAEAPAPVYTLEQQNALRAAKQYLDVLGFSRAGLIDQLSSEYGSGFPVETATWAADTVGADWNAEAVQSAQDYLNAMAFSRDGLYEQLTSEYGGQFTADEANYALSQVGY